MRGKKKMNGRNDPPDAAATMLFYDGECGFCNAAVQFVLKYEKAKQIVFSPLQSDFAEKLFARHKVDNDLRSLIVLHNGRFHKKSAAVRALAPFLKRPYNILIRCIGLFPPFLSDGVYDLIAKNRKRIIRISSCTVPSAADNDRFRF